jgi:hypothetical protein
VGERSANPAAETGLRDHLIALYVDLGQGFVDTGAEGFGRELERCVQSE